MFSGMKTVFLQVFGVVALGGACAGDSVGSASDGMSGSSTSAADTETTSTGTDATAETGSGSASGSETDTGAAACMSGMIWTQGDLESPLMHPGKACLSCHATQIGEDVVNLFAIAGTVYAGAHEPDDCNGVDGDGGVISVEITTADAKVLTLAVNSAGNFMYDQVEFGPLMFPIKAKVTQAGKERVMATPQMSGDCNSCHTEQGMNGAPGRILTP
jgi:hypothetical protein